MDTKMSNGGGQQNSIGKSESPSDFDTKLPNGSPFDKEKQSKNENNGAPPNLPYELSNIVDRLGDIFISVLEVKKMFNNATKNPTIGKADIEHIERMNSMLDNANKAIVSITSQLDKIKLKS
jgi:hypothetical protein